METIKKVGTGMTVLSIGGWIVKAIQLLTIALLLKKLNVYEYGLLELAWSFIATFNIFNLPGLSTAIIADAGVLIAEKKFVEVKSLFTDYFVLMFLGSIIAFLVLFISSYFWPFSKGATIMPMLLRIGSFTFLMTPFRSVLMVMFSAKARFVMQSLYTTFEELTRFVLLVLVMYLNLNNISNIVLTVVVSQFVLVLSFIYYFGKNIDWSRVISLKFTYWKGMLRGHGFWSIVVNYINGLSNNIRIWVIGVVLGTDFIGIYSVAQGMLSHTTSLIPLSSVVTPLIPKFASKIQALNNFISKAFKYQLIIFVFSGIIAGLLAPIILSIFFPKYLPSINIFWLLLLTLIPLSLSNLMTPVFFVFKLQKKLAIATILKTIVTSVVIFPLLIVFGWVGIVFEYFITLCFFTINRYFELKKNVPGFKVSFRNVLGFDEQDVVILSFVKSKIPFISRFI